MKGDDATSKGDVRRDRGCAICGGDTFELLHRQEFLLPGEQLSHYDVSACGNCGFAFARDLPPPEAFAAYYAENTKYTYEGSKNLPENVARVHRDSFQFVDEYVRVNSPPLAAMRSRVLDVGCATGPLLSYFKSAGYTELGGFDPSPVCRTLAKQVHDLDIDTASIETFVCDRPFDVVLLSSILEHIPDLPGALNRLSSFVAAEGLLFVQLPDAERFGIDMREPFLEFSIEHINYFTATSLGILLAKFGFSAAAIRHDVLTYGGMSCPVLTSLWRGGDAPKQGKLERSDVEPIRSYVTKSLARTTEISKRIEELVQTEEPVVVWGVGSLTARLVATTPLARMNIRWFVDSNTGLQGTRLLGREVRHPSTLKGETVTVFVSTFVYGEAIRKTLEQEYGYEGRIVLI